MKKLKLLSWLTLSIVLFISACHKDDPENLKGQFSNGIFIVNEGIFQTGVGTISFIDRSTNMISQDIFAQVNGRPLGSVAQSMTISNGKAYIVVNNASVVEVVDAATFESEGIIGGLVSPRYFMAVSNSKGYVTDWAGNVDGDVAVVDLASNTVTKTIPVKSGPEQMLIANSLVFVLNSGGWSTDSTVSVIDPASDEVLSTIQVNHRPTGIVKDKYGKVWVMCSGMGFNGYPQAGDSKGHLIRIDPVTLQVDFDYVFKSSSEHPEKLVINKNGDRLFFLFKGAINSFDVDNTTEDPVILAMKDNLYALGYDASSDYIYASDPLDYQQNGWVFRFKSADGALIDSIRAGIIPGNFCFGN
ncbi:MAG TPA: hypothetical protein PLJ84_01225 [Bacteroidales bacterium]|nr:hypothetical protein [Bacteroidales bacterium]